MDFMAVLGEHPGWIFLAATIVLLMTLLLFLVTAGLFTSIQIKTTDSKLGPMVVAYKTSVGPYKKAADLYTESWSLLPTREQIGLYYDDPQETPVNELRCAVGPILGKSDNKPVKEEMELMIKHGYKIFHLPDPGFVVTTSFPFRTSLSILIAIQRVYPRLKKYISEKSLCAYPAIEVYGADEIIFMMPLSHQEEFFVAEFQEEQESLATTDMGSVMTENKDDTLTDDDLFLKPRTPVRVSRNNRQHSVESNSLLEAVNNLANTVEDNSVRINKMLEDNDAADFSEVSAVVAGITDVYSEEPSDEEVEESGSTNGTSSFDDLADVAELKERQS